MDNSAIRRVKFSQLNLDDPFFDSLKSDYPGFVEWFYRKRNAYAYVLKEGNFIKGFLYLKDEDEEDTSISPTLKKAKRLKIVTFKVEAHGTIMGQKFMSLILRAMIMYNYEFTYVTILPKHVALIHLFERWGFNRWGCKGKELVYYKDLSVKDNIYYDFPRIATKGCNKFLLSIYPDFHTPLFPDSRLNNEKDLFIKDAAPSNSIEKVYLTKMAPVLDIKPRDLILIYRTQSGSVPAEYSSVVTSVCTLVEQKNIADFKDEQDFLHYCKDSIFSKSELENFYNSGKYPYVLKFLYNFPLHRRIIRKDLIEKVGMDREEYFGCVQLTDSQFDKILNLGEVDEGFIIN